jgi:hypothetical protein
MAGTRASRTTEPRGGGPQVIVDFVFDQGLLFIAIKNIGAAPAYEVRVDFGTRLVGLDGTKEVSAQAVFHRLEFLPPWKEIVTYFDTSVSFFASNQSTRITTKISCRTANGARRVSTIHHDLEIYRDIGYVRWPEPTLPIYQADNGATGVG